MIITVEHTGVGGFYFVLITRHVNWCFTDELCSNYDKDTAVRANITSVDLQKEGQRRRERATTPLAVQ